MVDSSSWNCVHSSSAQKSAEDRGSWGKYSFNLSVVVESVFSYISGIS